MKVKVLAAKYSLKDDASAEGAVDLTDRLQKAVGKGQLVFLVTNENIGSDPFPGRGKRLFVKFEVDGVPGEAAVGEGRTLRVPTDKTIRDAAKK